MDTTLDTMKHSESDLNLDLSATAKKGTDDDTSDHPYGVFFNLLFNINIDEDGDPEEDVDLNLSIDLGEDDDLSIDENDDGESVDF